MVLIDTGCQDNCLGEINIEILVALDRTSLCSGIPCRHLALEYHRHRGPTRQLTGRRKRGYIGPAPTLGQPYGDM